MAEDMRETIANAAKTLLFDKKVRKLTVKDIVEECHITRQTFYYHFEDIQALLKWMFEQEAIEIVKHYDLMVDYTEVMVPRRVYRTGEGEYYINKSACRLKDIVELFRDTGIGIAPEHQSRIFERFYRVDKSHSKASGGTGLGLSIVKHAAMYHGGKVELESQPGRGTEIRVTLPLPR